jgi:hypothetical protein
MPFTLSHAAASLPFRRFKPIWPALVIGTFAPDLQYFIWISDEDRSGHRFPDILLLTVPLALAVLWVFEYVVKGPAIELLPTGLQQRLRDKTEPLRFTGWRQFFLISLWTLIGTATHVAWDQFTHSYSRLSQHWPLLSSPVKMPSGYTVSLAHLLQHVSTIGGMAILCIWFLAWYSRTPPDRESDAMFSSGQKLAVVLSIAGMSLLLGYPLAVWRLIGHSLPIRRNFFIVTVFEASTLVFALQLLIYSASLRLATRQRSLPSHTLDQPGD